MLVHVAYDSYSFGALLLTLRDVNVISNATSSSIVVNVM